MKLITILKFGAFSFLLVAIPLLLAVGFFYIHEAHTSTYYGFFIGLVIDGILLIVLLPRVFKTSIKYVNKKEKERELEKQTSTF